MRVGIVVIHGIAPQARYGIEDEFATALTERLNLRAGSGPDRWVLSSQPQPFVPSADPETVRATVDHVSRAGSDDAFDVLEAYWSPIDKHHTTPLSVASWLLKSIFVPLNNDARFPGSVKKIVFDLGYVLFALALAVSLLLLMLWAAGRSYAGVVDAVLPTPAPTASAVASASPAASPGIFALAAGPIAAPSPVATRPPLGEVLVNPLALMRIFSLRESAIALAGVAGAICGAQALSAVLGGALVRRSRARSRRPHWRAVVRIAAVLALALALLAVAGWAPLDNGGRFGWTICWFILTLLALQGASAVGRGFLVDRLGDVQIYTTTNENSEYFDLRQRIRSQAERVLLGMIARYEHGAPYYDSIVVAGHSLGSTIGMDALLRVHEIHEASQLAVSDADWGRVRAFITFGTALEKTKFFFAARRPSFSAKREQWHDDLNGHLFSADPAVLGSDNAKDPANPLRGIFWLNLWYPTDVIANAIESYRSCERPRLWGLQRTSVDHPVCLNQRLALPLFPNVFPHGAYLADERFWTAPKPIDPARSEQPLGVLDVLTELLDKAAVRPAAASAGSPSPAVSTEPSTAPSPPLRLQPGPMT